MFSQTPPKNIPTLDAAGLVALVTQPQKAAELWKQYEQHRKDYDAYKAAIDAEQQVVAKRAYDLDNLAATIKAEGKKLDEQQSAFAGQLTKLRELQRAVEDREAALAATVETKNAEFAGRQAALDAEADKWTKQLATEQARITEVQLKQNAKAQELEEREAAVAEREAKAEALAKLLKSV